MFVFVYSRRRRDSAKNCCMSVVFLYLFVLVVVNVVIVLIVFVLDV